MRPPQRPEAPRYRRRASRKPRSSFGAGLIALGFLLSGLGGVGAYFMPVLTAALQVHSPNVDVTSRPSSAPQASATPVQPAQQAQAVGNAFTVLLMGSDNDAKFSGLPLTQSMILVRVQPATSQVVMFSIPRDLWVQIPGYGYGKIDQAYELAGAQGAIRTVESDFNVRIDDYAWVGLTGLVKLVDLLGGVDIIPTNPVLDDLYPNDINTQNVNSLKRLAVMPGPQHMNGLQALEYVRSRHSDVREDFGRSFRQQQVLIALREKAKTLNPTDLPDLVQTFNGELKTSMSPQRIAQLLPLAGRLQTSNIKQIVLLPPYTSASTVGSSDVVMPAWSRILPLAHRYFPTTP
jgi:LCP family protein required for cell wall assembly